jgi:hypothetical protein
MFKFLKPKNKIVEQTTSLLHEQIDKAKINNDQWNEKFGSKFSLGYIMGFSTILIKSKTKNDKDTANGTEGVFENLFGRKNGVKRIATAKMYSENNEFKKGLEKARIDLIEFVDNDGESPHSLFDFLKHRTEF